MIELETLIDILQISAEKNGEILLTNRHLLNILKMTQRKIEGDELAANMAGNAVYADTR